MRDRLEALKGMTPPPRDDQLDKQQPDDDDTKEYEDTADTGNPLMETVSEARQKIKTLSAVMDTIDRHHRAAMSATDPKQAAQAQTLVEQATSQFAELCDDIRRQLREASVSLRKQAPTDGEPPNDVKRARTLLQVTTKKFLDVARQFEKQAIRHKKAREEDMARRLRVLRPTLTAAQVGELIEHGVPDDERIYSPVHSPTLLSAEAIAERRRLAQGELSWMEARRAEMVRLNESAAQVAALMADVALLVQQQGDVIDRVEDFLSGAEAYGKQGKKQLDEAHKAAALRRERRIKMVKIFIVSIIVLLMVAYLMIQYGTAITMMFYIISVVFMAGGMWWLYRRLSPSRLLGLKKDDEVDDCCECCCV